MKSAPQQCVTKKSACSEHCLALLLAAGIWMLATPVLAEQSQVAHSQKPVQSAALQLEEIPVSTKALSDTRPVRGYQAKKSTTANKTDTALIDTPQAISVIPQDIIKDQSIQSLSDAVRYVPGVTAAQGEGNRDQLVLRGNNSSGDFYLDGMRDDIQTYRDFYNTDRIEVLKGPNGMIFGRGASGGAINRVSKEAGWDPVREVQVSYGAYDHKRSSIDIGQGLNDQVAFRLNAVYEDSASYRQGVTLERYGIAPTFTLRPSLQTKIVVGAEYFKDERVADRGVPSVNSAGNIGVNSAPFQIQNTGAFFGSAAQSPTATETNAFNALLEHTFDNGLTLRNRTRYADYDKFYQNVYAGGAVLNNGNVRINAYRDETQRTNLINQTDLIWEVNTGSVRHKLLAGMELARQDTDNMRRQPTANSELVGNFSALSPVVITPVTFNGIRRNQTSQVDIAAFYLQDQLELNDHWQAVLGLRYDSFKTNYNGFSTPGSFLATEVKDEFVSPRAGLIFKPVAQFALYGSYSLSYVPRAGDQMLSLTAQNQNFAPEKFINQEIGAKWDINQDLSFTAALYQLERENVAVTDPNNVSQSILVNGQEIKGLELSAAGKLTSQWSVFGGYANQDGELTENQSATLLKGADLALTPRETLSLWNRYQINEMWGVALGLSGRSSMFAQEPTTTQSTVLAGYTRLDAALYAKLSDQLRMQINIENLTDKHYALYAHNNNNITPGSPTNVRATLIYHF